MDDSDLNRIIEDAFLNIVRNEGGLQRSVVVDSSSNNAMTPQQQHLDFLYDYSSRWFQSLENYHSCMRDYHKNISYLDRTSADILRNIASPEVMRNNNLRNSIFATSRYTLPIVQVERSDPITPTYPTISQIMAATYVYTCTEETRVEHERCPITLENFVVGEEVCEILHCHHLFKWASIQTWFSRNNHCPVCRHDIRVVT